MQERNFIVQPCKVKSRRAAVARYCFALWCLAVFFSVLAGCAGEREKLSLTEERAQGEEEKKEKSESRGEAEAVQSREICVDLCGAVANPGVYFLKEGSRLYQAVEMAGGFTQEAATEGLNQAQELTDGQQVRVPTVEEVESQTEIANQGNSQNPEIPGVGDGRVNLNTAGVDELMTLNGIGESRAQAILTYREENGAFQSIEQVKEVSGIGDGIYSRIKDQIVVE